MKARGGILLWFLLLPTLSVFSQPPTPPIDADSLFLEGLRFYRAGDAREARSRFRSLLNRFPSYHDARILYGRLLSWDEDYQGALSQFDSVLFSQPAHREARFAKAQVFAWMGRYRSAADILTVLIQEDPKSAPSLQLLANVYFWGKNPKKALEYYEASYLRDPDSPETLRGLARVHRALRSEDLSMLWYRKLLERVPGDREALAEINRLTYRSDHEIQMQGSYESFVKPGFREHTIAQVAYYVALTEDWKPFLQAGWISKFGFREGRYGGGAYATLGYEVGLLAQILVAPGARMAPRVDGLTEITIPVGSGVELAGEYRFMKFDTMEVHVPAPGLTLYVAGDTWFTLKSYIGLSPENPTSLAGTLTMWYRSEPHTTWRLGAFTGYESFRATSLPEALSLKSTGGFLGVKTRMSSFLAVDLLYQFTSRSPSSNSHVILLTTSLLF